MSKFTFLLIIGMLNIEFGHTAAWPDPRQQRNFDDFNGVFFDEEAAIREAIRLNAIENAGRAPVPKDKKKAARIAELQAKAKKAAAPAKELTAEEARAARIAELQAKAKKAAAPAKELTAEEARAARIAELQAKAKKAAAPAKELTAEEARAARIAELQAKAKKAAAVDEEASGEAPAPAPRKPAKKAVKADRVPAPGDARRAPAGPAEAEPAEAQVDDDNVDMELLKNFLWPEFQNAEEVFKRDPHLYPRWKDQRYYHLIARKLYEEKDNLINYLREKWDDIIHARPIPSVQGGYIWLGGDEVDKLNSVAEDYFRKIVDDIILKEGSDGYDAIIRNLFEGKLNIFEPYLFQDQAGNHKKYLFPIDPKGGGYYGLQYLLPREAKKKEAVLNIMRSHTVDAARSLTSVARFIQKKPDKKGKFFMDLGGNACIPARNKSCNEWVQRNEVPLDREINNIIASGGDFYTKVGLLSPLYRDYIMSEVLKENPQFKKMSPVELEETDPYKALATAEKAAQWIDDNVKKAAKKHRNEWAIGEFNKDAIKDALDMMVLF